MVRACGATEWAALIKSDYVAISLDLRWARGSLRGLQTLDDVRNRKKRPAAAQ